MASVVRALSRMIKRSNPVASEVLLRICLFLAALKVVGGIIVYAVGNLGTVSVAKIPNGVYLLHIVVFGAAGIWLLYASRSDNRAKHLGVVFFLIASSFSDPFVRRLPEVLELTDGVVGPLLSNLQPDAFEPYFLWLFFCEFPRGFSSATTHRVFRLGLKVSFWIGMALFLVNIIGMFSPPGSNASGTLSFLALFERNAGALYYWMAKYALEIPVLPISLWRTRDAPIEERRRVRFFLVGLALGSLPVMLVVTLEALFPSFHARMNVASSRFLAALILYPLILSMPITTAYSVLVHRVLEIKLIIRQALWYGLARYGVILLAAIPFSALAFYLYQRRDESVSGLLSGWRLPVFVAATVSIALALRLRRRVFDTIDRKYFREQYDSRTILANLVEKSRATSSIEELSQLLSGEIDRALHLESVAILVRRPDDGALSSPTGDTRPLKSSALLALVEGSSDPLDIDLEDPRSLLHRLSLDDQEWLADGAFRLLVPLIASDGHLIGLITLGEKKSELRFSWEDRILLKTIAAAVALTLENRLLRSRRHRGSKSTSPSSLWESRSLEDALANECVACHHLQSPVPSRCGRCGGKVETTHVPHVLLGKFRLERRIGAGAMGVVYRAVDLALNRDVAIKTLPRMSPDYSMRLRREARAMASIVHPNLALIFGSEAWHGTPMLIFEYLEGGTLADRLKVAPFTLKQTLELGLVLASVLERTHGAGILHRDIKPSNIGYTVTGTPKLLDFGLAHVLHDSRREFQLRKHLAEHSAMSTASLRSDDLTSLTLTNHIVGTPVYLSPEAVQKKRPDPSFDLWAVAIVLYEALTGRNPMVRGDVTETLAFISRGVVPDIREALPDCSPDMAIFLNEALSKDITSRPSTASELRSNLERVASTIEPTVAINYRESHPLARKPRRE